jgi:hypothetical protein
MDRDGEHDKAAEAGGDKCSRECDYIPQEALTAAQKLLEGLSQSSKMLAISFYVSAPDSNLFNEFLIHVSSSGPGGVNGNH